MSKDFYEEKIEKIGDLIKLKDYKKALKLLDEELNMPYIPMKYEDTFITLKKELLFFLKDKDQRGKVFNVEDLIEMLYQNEEKQAIALDLLKDYNLREHVLEVKKRIETWTPKERIKTSFLFELLAQQQVNVNIKIDEINVNPAVDSIIEDEKFRDALNEISSLSEKEPQIKILSEEQLNKYLLLTFPNKIGSPKELGKSIFNTVSFMLKGTTVLTTKEKEIFELLNKKNDNNI